MLAERHVHIWRSSPDDQPCSDTGLKENRDQKEKQYSKFQAADLEQSSVGTLSHTTHSPGPGWAPPSPNTVPWPQNEHEHTGTERNQKGLIL